MTNELLSQIEEKILNLHEKMTELKKEYAVEYTKIHGDYFGTTPGEFQADFLTKPKWEQDYLRQRT